MIINFEEAIKKIKEEIQCYKTGTDFKGNKLYQNIVSGMNRSIDVLENYRLRSGYSNAISGLSKDDLKNLKSCIDSKIREIEKEEKTVIYAAVSDGISEYFLTFDEAKKSIIEEISKEKEADLSSRIRFSIEKEYIEESQISEYIRG